MHFRVRLSYFIPTQLSETDHSIASREIANKKAADTKVGIIPFYCDFLLIAFYVLANLT